MGSRPTITQSLFPFSFKNRSNSFIGKVLDTLKDRKSSQYYKY